jgi:beta-lactam-binding protein with PASTA domain
MRDAEEAALVLIGEDGRALVPDLSGLTVAQVRAALARGGLDLDVEGDGLAVAQEPEPGTILAAGARRVRVRFAPGA